LKKSDLIRFIDFEISSICNAGCSVCPRRRFGHFTEFPHTYWSIEDTMKTIDPEIARNLIGLQFCGNFGDPMGNPDISKITKYFRENNEKVAIYVKTNGGIGDKESYREMANLGSIMTFGIDGYGEKNELYRVNVKWEKLMENLLEFSNNCNQDQLEIQFIMWNETTDQILPIIDLIREIGIGTLYLRKPFTTGIKTEVFNMKGQSTHFLTEIVDSRLFKYFNTVWKYEDLNKLKNEIIDLKLENPILEKSDLKVYPREERERRTYQYSEIESIEESDTGSCQTCFSKNFKNPYNLMGEVYNIYITHNKFLMPCCYLPPGISNEMFFSSGNESPEQKQILNKMSDLGFQNFSLEEKTLRDVFDNGILHNFVYDDLINNKGFKSCKNFCSKPKNKII